MYMFNIGSNNNNNVIRNNNIYKKSTNNMSPVSTYSSKSSTLNNNITPNNMMPSPSYVNYHNPTYNSNINLCISDDGMSVSSGNNSHSPSQPYRNSQYSYDHHNVPAISVASDNCVSKMTDGVNYSIPLQRSRSYVTRNPVTGNGIDNGGNRSRRLGSTKGTWLFIFNL